MLSLTRTSRTGVAVLAKAQSKAVTRRTASTIADHISKRQPNRDSETEYRPQQRRFVAREKTRGQQWKPQEQTSAARSWPKLEIPEEATRFTFTFNAEKTNSQPIDVAWTDKFLYVEDPAMDNGRRALKVAPIRDSCACPRCRDVASGQKTFSSIEIPIDIRLQDVKPTDEGLEITFLNEIPRFAEHKEIPHVTLLPWQSVEMSLKRKGMEDVALPRPRAILRRTGVVYWDRETIAHQVRRIDYDEFMKDDSEAFWDVIVDICRFGLVFLKNVPRDEESVVRIATRIANIRETFYGRTFDVRAKQDAENVAYTSDSLGLHQDLLYLDTPPKIQVLHCMENSCDGGESLFSDGDRVGRLLWPFVTSNRMAPLAEHHVPYQYKKNGFHYFSSRHVLDGNPSGFTNVFWSPPFQGRYLSPVKDIRRWIEPARIFSSLINDPAAVYEQKLEPGECVLFDNLRVLHGRKAFDTTGGGDRWLRGAYIAAEDFLSKAAHIPVGLAEKYRGYRPWAPGLAQKELMGTAWHNDVVNRIKEIDPKFEGLA